MAHKVPQALTGPSFGLGKVSVKKYKVTGAPATTRRPPHTPPTKRRPKGLDSPERDPNHFPTRKAPPKNNWKPRAKKLNVLAPWQLSRTLRRDRIRGGRVLMRYPYLVRLELRNTGGGTGRRSEVGLRFKASIRLALGKAWADNSAMGRAQIGAMRECRTGIYKSLPPGWRTCPVHFNNLGWRDLSSKLSGKKKILVINQPRNPKKANTILWFGFQKDPGPVLVKLFKKAGRYTLGAGKMSIWRVKIKKTSRRGGYAPYRRRGGWRGRGRGPGNEPIDDEEEDGSRDDGDPHHRHNHPSGSPGGY